jgi:hypothetical protein
MLADFVKELVGLGRRAQAVQVVPVPGDPRTLIVAHEGAMKERAVPAPLLDARVETHGDLVAFVTDAALCSAPIVYFDGCGCVVVRNQNDRREFLRLVFAPSMRWLAVVKLGQGVRLAPRDAIRFLRFELGGVGAEATVAALRKIDFKRAEGAGSQIKRGAESYGRQVELAVQGADSVPESFRVKVCPVVNDGFADLMVELEVCVELDVEAQAIEFRLAPDAVETARETFLRAVGAQLREALGDRPVFRGVPVIVGGAETPKAVSYPQSVK